MTKTAYRCCCLNCKLNTNIAQYSLAIFMTKTADRCCCLNCKLNTNIAQYSLAIFMTKTAYRCCCLNCMLNTNIAQYSLAIFMTKTGYRNACLQCQYAECFTHIIRDAQAFCHTEDQQCSDVNTNIENPLYQCAPQK